jgi:ABC-type nitrate/sulfonate/bicarbonate transport system permease component
VWPPLVVLGGLVAVWEAWVRAGDIDPSVLAPPSRVARSLHDSAAVLVSHAATTLGETAIGLVVGTVVGLVLAVAISTFPIARRALEPLLVVLQTIPPIVLAPVLVLALGFGWMPRIVVVALIVLFPVAIAAAGGFSHADRGAVDLIRAFGGGRAAVFRYVRFPSALPAILDGLTISAAYSVAGAAIAEQIGGARSGLGLYIARSQRSFRSDQVLAGVVVIASVSLLVYAVLVVASRFVAPWRQPDLKETS